jgi:hypothetical protein
MIRSRSAPRTGPKSIREINLELQSDQALNRDFLVLELQNRIIKLNDQARIFIPLIALCLIVAIPVWSKSLTRFLILLLSPFVLFPLAFCVIHLTLAWRGIVRARNRIRDWDMNQQGGQARQIK